MNSFVIEGGRTLSGTISPLGAKNEALQVISAVLLTCKPVTISNIPDILDVRNLIGLLEGMGVDITREAPDTYTFCAAHLDREFIESREFVARCASLRDPYFSPDHYYHASEPSIFHNPEETKSDAAK